MLHGHFRVHFVSIFQKTREGCGCFWGLFGGSRGKLRESRGKIAGRIFPNREMQQILGFWAPDLPGTLCRHCQDLVPTFRAGCFLKSAVPAFSSFFFSEFWCSDKRAGCQALPLVFSGFRGATIAQWLHIS